jgi:hypothetical protein
MSVMKNLPPKALTRAWISIIQDERIPSDIIKSRIKLINKFFGSIKIASMYIEETTK